MERLSPAQWERLVRELERGPLAHGWSEDQCWTLGRIRIVIARRLHVGYTVQGVWHLLRRHSWSAQVPVRRALERDNAAVEVWKAEVWPRLKGPRRPVVPGSASPTRQARA